MLARSAGKRVVLMAVPFVALALLVLLRPPPTVPAGAVRAAGALVLLVALAGGAFGAYLWRRGGDRVV